MSRACMGNLVRWARGGMWALLSLYEFELYGSNSYGKYDGDFL